MKEDPPASTNYTASGKKQKKRKPFLRLFTKRSNSREAAAAEGSTVPMESSEKKEEDLPTEVKDKE